MEVPEESSLSGFEMEGPKNPVRMDLSLLEGPCYEGLSHEVTQHIVVRF